MCFSSAGTNRIRFKGLEPSAPLSACAPPQQTAMRSPSRIPLAERQQVLDEIVEVLLAHPAIEATRHRVREAGHNVPAGVADRLAEVVLRADPGLARGGDRPNVR